MPVVSLDALPKRLDTAIRFLLYVILFWAPYSPAVIESCVPAALLLLLIKRGIIHRGRISNMFKPPESDLNYPIAFFVAVCLISSAGSIFWGQSLQGFFIKTLEWFIIYFLVIEVFTEKRHVAIALIVLTVTAWGTVIDSLLQYHVLHRDIFLNRVVAAGDRATAAFKTPNDLGGFLSFWLTYAFTGLFVKTKNLWGKLFFLVSFFLSCWAMVLTFSRGAWMAVAIGAVFFILIRYRHRLPQILLGGALVVLSCYFLFMKISGEDSSFFLKRGHTVDWRWSVWEDSMPMVRDRILLGHGLNTYMQIFQEYRRDQVSQSPPTYAHNCYIQIAGELGLIGLAGFLWIIGTVFVSSFKAIWAVPKNAAVLMTGLLAALLGFLSHSFTDTNFYSLQLSTFFWLMVGLQMVLVKIERETLCREKRRP